MAGAMRKMGIYLGLVEDDDARAYGRYDVRQSDPHDRYGDGRYDDGRYDEGRFDEGRYDPARYDDGRYDSGRYDERRYDRPGDPYPGDRTEEGRRREADRHDGDRYDGERFDPERYDGDRVDDGRPGVRAAAPAGSEPAVLRRAGATRLGLAQPVSGIAPAASGPSRIGAVGGGMSGGIGGGGVSGGVSGGAGAAAGLAAREPVTVAPEPAPAPVAQPYRITTLHPKTYNEARAIGEAFRDGSPVIMNLTELDHADARRLVDFAAGLVFGLRGSIEPVTAKVFLLSPRDVDVTAEDKAKIREGGFFEES
ncbi:cell division protein SepF [Geodermatophilus amargosae]|uniref:cell division protein SepF n=1 Tax=Geodermatophilus amargosae TaxID=1296565 RepID=UPI003F81CED7